MNQSDNTFYVILNDDAEATRLKAEEKEAKRVVNYDPVARRAFDLKLAFRLEARTGHEILIETRQAEHWAMPDFSDYLLVRHEHFGVGPANKGDRFLDLQCHLYRDGAQIVGIYDLKKPFDQAKAGVEILPDYIEQGLRNILYERLRPNFSMLDKVRMMSTKRREAFKQGLSICALD